MNGSKFALTSPPRVDTHYDYCYSAFSHRERLLDGVSYSVSFDMRHIYEPPPKPKRKWSTAMGLRKPKGA
ncbi:hypothetical protein KIP49_gp56 [Mycobacterium phage Scorpia]|uniref:Uncharacterized protein n=2 Tax=Benedictvirus TaxID=2946819 RepID=A0A482JBI0_9CAUD|nr:hypothetical protein AVV06_gp59 [Mycobacterium phage Chadwick]YP_010060747.1 hypothetical protein KIP49_gp56 [Mycobacterium phage Scorpia]ALA06763.1 hypothetical protein SEA_CHADWICK_36 [Mycobacterium phage Chadwick]QBP29036.1 hypothetical protein SEA_SCORPIA_36 [Mycobacterium phage Scorpia]